ncbi:hypothetical protein GCM10010411_23880 [Actinomadura fulvescens]|uniref:Uncharacterized protein n=1 Tax=Actinomadura fulvescens TaxID=46160 RepID=A0ABP6C188_9ACTN
MVTSGVVVLRTGSSAAADRWVGLEASSGKLLWVANPRGVVDASQGLSPPVARTSGVIPVRTMTHDRFTGIDVRNGRVRWTDL